MTPPVRPERPDVLARPPLADPNAQAIRLIAARYAEQGAIAEEIVEVLRARHPDLISTFESERARTPMDVGERIGGSLRSGYQGASLNLGDELMGLVQGALDKDRTIGEAIDTERGELTRYRDQFPGRALGAELIGGVGTGAGLATASRGTALAPAARVLASGLGGGTVAGYGSGEGGPLSGDRAIRAGVGGAVGGTLGYVAGKVATSRAGDAVARKGRDLLEGLTQAVDGPTAYGVPFAGARSTFDDLDAPTQAAVRSLYERMGSEAGETVPQARSLLDEIGKAKMSGSAMAADVIPGGQRELRRAANISPRGGELARQRLAERGANVGVRARTALTEATGLEPQTVQGGIDDLVTQRAAKAAPVYAQAESEAVANRMTPRTPATHAALQEPDIKATIAGLRRLRDFRGMEPDDPRLLQAAYRVLSERQATLGNTVAQSMEANKPGSVGQFGLRDVGQAKKQVMDALAGPQGPTPSFRPAVEQYADDSALRRAYESGADLFNKPVGEIQSAMGKMTPDEVELFKRGAFDALVESRIGAMPNPDLGDVARASKPAGQATVNTQGAADRIKALFGEDEYQRLLGVAKAEGKFSQTAQAVTGNSTTAQQLADMGVFGQFAQDAAQNISPSPAWWGARIARAGFRRGSDEWAKRFNEPANRLGADLLTREGDQPIRTLLEYLESIGTTDKGRKAATGVVTGALTRTGVGRVP